MANTREPVLKPIPILSAAADPDDRRNAGVRKNASAGANTRRKKKASAWANT